MINHHEVTILQLVPSLLRALLDDPGFQNCRSLRHIFCGGETMTEDIPRRAFAALDIALHNMYGPSETAIDALYYSVPRTYAGGPVPIGRPVANTQAFVLDRYRELLPIGVPGELHIGGIQVGRGYHNRPELTAERFIADPFRAAVSARLYRTGDKVRILPDGRIEFLGRMDHQVKLRGFRIELGEIEWTLQQHPAVQECAVALRTDTPDVQQLVAYVTSATLSSDSLSELTGFLRDKLPRYMVPSAYVLLDALPLTPNGKLDRNALPPPQARSSEHRESQIAPRTPTEESVATSWRKILRLEKIGIHDNFFDLGGHSLLLVRLIGEINWRHRVKLGVPDVIRNPTVEQVAKLIDARGPKSTRLSTVVPLSKKGRSGTPVYFVYATSSEFRIAQDMDEEHRVFGIEVRWPLPWRRALAENRTEAFPSLEELVVPYAEALRDHAPSSPLRAGWPFLRRIDGIRTGSSISETRRPGGASCSGRYPGHAPKTRSRALARMAPVSESLSWPPVDRSRFAMARWCPKKHVANESVAAPKGHRQNTLVRQF